MAAGASDITVNYRSIYLDAWRGYASLTVLVAHAIQVFFMPIYGAESELAAISGTAARYAVIVFFMLSGYFIVGSILNNVSRNGRFDLSSYLVARFARIYPPLLVSVCLVLVLWLLIRGLELPGSLNYLRLSGAGDYLVREKFDLELSEVLSTLLLAEAITGFGMLNVNGPLWSLSIEFWLYGIVGLSAALFWKPLSESLRQKILIAFLLGILLIGFLTYFPLRNLFFSSFWFFGGMVILLESGRSLRLSRIFNNVIAAAALISVIVTAWAGVMAPRILDATRNSYSSVIVQLLLCAPIALLLFRISPKREGRLLRVGAWSAGFSYSLYIIHLPIMLFGFSLGQFLLTSWTSKYSLLWASLFATVSMLLCIAAAYCVAKFAENSVRNRKYFDFFHHLPVFR